MAAYVQAAIPEPYRVLGKRLKPFCLGHQLLLERFGCSFASGGPHGFADLILGVFICSQTYEQALESLNSRWVLLRVKLWGLFWRRFDYIEKIKLFDLYVSEAKQQPQFWIEREGRESNIPFNQFLKSKLMQELGMGESEALNTPYQSAIWNFCTWLESEGAIRLFSERDIALIEAAKRTEVACP